MSANVMGMDGLSFHQFNRGCQLLQGGRVQDQAEAAALIGEAAERSGAAAAQHNLGTVHERGVGVPKNLALAVTWYSKVGPGRYCSPRHPTHFKPSFLELDGIL